MIFRVLLCGLFLLLFTAPAKAQESRVVVSIKPLHSLVAAIMGDTGTPVLLVDGMHSQHGYQLKPSQIEILHHADIVFYIAPTLETFLARTLETLPASLRRDALIDAPGVITLKTRSSGAWEADHDEDSAGQDPHIWLDTGNAKAISENIAEELGALYPANKAVYEKNAKALNESLDKLDSELTTVLAPVKNIPFIVFHDAWQYFEHEQGLSGAGSITLEPEQAPGVKRISAMRSKIKSSGVRCVFAEPQFNNRLVQTVTEGTAAKTGILDPLGADIPAGPALYFTLMRRMGEEFRTCLEPRP